MEQSYTKTIKEKNMFNIYGLIIILIIVVFLPKNIKLII